MKVEIKNLTKHFGDVPAVKNLNLNIKDQEFIALLGPSGCGKTTTLRCIAGLEKPDSGEIFIGDQLVNEISPQKRDCAMVFQSYALYPHMTVYDNISFPLKARKYPEQEKRKLVKEVTELLGISHLLKRKPKELSGGEAQRVALGRALVRRPQVFLMDEPLSNLDARLRLYMRVEIKKLQKELKVTTIYVTHDQAEAMTMADRIAMLNKGILQQVGTPSELYLKPANMFVGGFLGREEMNYFDCSFLDKKGTLDAGFITLKLSKDLAKLMRKEASSELVIGVRPENIILSPNKMPDATEIKVYVTEPLGSETVISFKAGDTIYKIEYPGIIELKSGDSAWITLDQNKINIFDKKSGKIVF